MPPTPQSNVERYLSVIAGYGGEIPSEPSSRAEWYLNKIVEQGGIGGKLKPKPVAELPAVGESGILYLVPIRDTSGQNTHNEYFWVEEESKYELLGQAKIEIDLSHYVENTRKVGGVPLSADIPVSVTGDSAITVTNTGTASAIGYSITHKDSGVTAGSKGDMTNQTPGFGGTFKALSATVDAKGHITNLAEHSVQLPDTEATQSAKGLMSAEDKAKLDTIIDPTLSDTGKAADAKATGDAITALRDYLKSMDVSRTASGNPATFADGYAANVKELVVTITPTQSGSGDPSPTNIRPIFGVSSVSVTRTGQNGANSQTVTVQLTDGSNLLTVYGGTLDVTTGKLTVTHKGTDMGGLNFNYNSRNDVFAVNIDDCKFPITFGYEDGLCSMFTVFRGEFIAIQIIVKISDSQLYRTNPDNLWM